jgi:hypothetical protein
VVGVSNEATPNTFEYRLGATVSFVDPAAGAARLRRICGIDFYERHPGSFGLVGQKRAELGERPGVQGGPLGLAKPYPLTDSRQFFDGNTAFGAFSLGHDAFRNLVIDIGGEAGFSSSPLFEQPPGRVSFLGLQPFPQFELALPVAVEPGTVALSPVLVVAMFTIPMSTPTNPLLGSASGASVTSMAAYRNHLPFR